MWGVKAERCIGTVEGDRPGPTVVVTGGLHGNEPAGVVAIRSAMEQLQRRPLRGTVHGIACNLGALAANQRFLERDLNRSWTTEALDPLRRTSAANLRDEDAEQRDLLEIFERIIDSASGPVVFLDLHTSSGPGAPFACMADVLRNRRVAFALPIPVVLGLEEVIEGSMLGYLCDLGHVGVAVEGGRNDDPAAPDRLETAIWSTLIGSGAVLAEDVPELDERRRRLASAADGFPSVVEIRHRHVCREGDGFEMVPGFRSFQPVRKGALIARDKRGEIHAPTAGLLLLPRYQGSGEDGFFLARPVRRFWLDLSAQLRNSGADRWLSRLPGVVPHPVQPETYLVDPRVARIRVAEVFHLLGYRRVRPEGHLLSFSRRRQDHPGLAALPSPRGI